MPRIMPLDLYREGDRYVLSADLPGVDPESVDIDVDGRLLTIKAVRSRPAQEGITWLARERGAGQYQRRLELGRDVDVAGISAKHENGVLRVEIPVSEAAKPRKIEVAAA